ncbi:unnamed protein product [Nippostrongylus brasiliensis]|uniref:Uncharacterized protein n=1 Tax=Nippostrongylus brasiliensis TaxID=27835 RepID=A0A0N4XJ39_NIPBR|nr:unnamed protein product [Nippostrongylus brasiliensis]
MTSAAPILGIRRLATGGSDEKPTRLVSDSPKTTVTGRAMAVGHYHSINEFQLVQNSPKQSKMPVITGAGLLV